MSADARPELRTTAAAEARRRRKRTIRVEFMEGDPGPSAMKLYASLLRVH
jgi:hypothetical protein